MAGRICEWVFPDDDNNDIPPRKRTAQRSELEEIQAGRQSRRNVSFRQKLLGKLSDFHHDHNRLLAWIVAGLFLCAMFMIFKAVWPNNEVQMDFQPKSALTNGSLRVNEEVEKYDGKKIVQTLFNGIMVDIQKGLLGNNELKNISNCISNMMEELGHLSSTKHELFFDVVCDIVENLGSMINGQCKLKQSLLGNLFGEDKYNEIDSNNSISNAINTHH